MTTVSRNNIRAVLKIGSGMFELKLGRVDRDGGAVYPGPTKPLIA
jgi:hypothetical protein